MYRKDNSLTRKFTLLLHIISCAYVNNLLIVEQYPTSKYFLSAISGNGSLELLEANDTERELFQLINKSIINNTDAHQL